ncbi:MAG: VanW family protein [Christensenellales bacterium]
MTNSRAQLHRPVRPKRHVNKRRMMMAAAVVILAACIVIGLGFAMGWIGTDRSEFEVIFDGGTITGNITINGISVTNLTPEQAKLALSQEAQDQEGEFLITLTFAGREEKVKASLFGVKPNVDETIRQAMLLTRTGSIHDRREAAGNTEPTAFNLEVSYDDATLEDTIRSAIPQINFAPIEPHVEINTAISGSFEFVEGQPGITVNEEEFVKLVAEAVRSENFTGTIEVPGEILQPTYTMDQIKANTVKISSATTSFANSSSDSRVFNIKKMCGLLSGSTIKPGETYSVNDTAGPRTVENGWQKAKGIENGVYTDQAGGGICQVSTTLYNALLKADVEIVSRRPHSIPASYVKHALDAMITTGGSDLKFKNTTDWPMFLLLYVDEEKKTVTAEVYGTPLADGMTIKLESVDVEITPFDPTPVVVTDPDLVRKGRNRIVAEAWKVYYDKDGKEIKRVKANTSTYAASRPHVLQSSITPSPTKTVEQEPTPTPEEDSEE